MTLDRRTLLAAPPAPPALAALGIATPRGRGHPPAAGWSAPPRTPLLTRLFTDYGNTGVGWTGADSTYSAPAARRPAAVGLLRHVPRPGQPRRRPAARPRRSSTTRSSCSAAPGWPRSPAARPRRPPTLFTPADRRQLVLDGRQRGRPAGSAQQILIEFDEDRAGRLRPGAGRHGAGPGAHGPPGRGSSTSPRCRRGRRPSAGRPGCSGSARTPTCTAWRTSARPSTCTSPGSAASTCAGRGEFWAGDGWSTDERRLRAGAHRRGQRVQRHAVARAVPARHARHQRAVQRADPRLRGGPPDRPVHRPGAALHHAGDRAERQLRRPEHHHLQLARAPGAEHRPPAAGHLQRQHAGQPRPLRRRDIYRPRFVDVVLA